MPASAIETFAHHLHQEGFEGSQFAFFSTAPTADTSRLAIKFARALADQARVVLVGLGWDDAAIRAISTEPGAAGLAEIAAGTASFGAIITRDKASGLNLIVSGRPGADKSALVSSPAMDKNFAALADSYGHVVVDAGALDGAELSAIARIASHAVLIVESLSAPATARARDRLIDQGFDDVTILIAGRTEPAASAAPDIASPVAA